jgi:hypothetical protein
LIHFSSQVGGWTQVYGDILTFATIIFSTIDFSQEILSLLCSVSVQKKINAIYELSKQDYLDKSSLVIPGFIKPAMEFS